MAVFDHSADMRLLLAAISRSPIIVRAEPPVLDFADWCERQKPADIDTVILGWIRSQVPQRVSH